MREFFKGWRRKCGVVTLVLACFLFGIWMRSQFITDSHVFSGIFSERCVAQSQSGQFSILKLTMLPLTERRQAPIDVIWSMNYFVLITPLTLLSAYLILWPVKRVTKQDTNSEGA